ncbi:MAG TPA: PfkB family carbohydrate kinase [Terriglobia bacterium]|nr:PfkB family carbohydrate kinase [Terriglobia bacterium]
MTTLSSDRNALLALLERFPRQQIIMLGDLVADQAVYGEIARVSREAPVLILKERERQVVPGGGANAANNLAALGARVIPVGVVGNDETGDALLQYFRDRHISTRHINRVRNHSTPTKTRILGGLSHWQRQQIVRIDREPIRPLAAEVRAGLTRDAAALLGASTGLLVADYGYKTTNAQEVELLRRRARGHKLPITIDSRYDLLTYKNLTAATPNEPEVEAAFGQSIGSDIEKLHTLGRRFLHRQKLQALLVTRGRDGMALFEARRPPCHLPIFGSDQAVDVTGAGDTVIAAFTLALAAGGSFLQAALLANCAGGIVVMKRGTATVSLGEITEAIRNT